MRDKVTFCSNCGSEKITSKWVYKYQKEDPIRTSIDEKIKTKIDPPPSIIYEGISEIYTCGDCITTSIPIQLVLSCEACGYTVTKSLSE